MRGVLDVCAIKSPGFGNRRAGYLEDIATLTGGTFITEQLGLTLETVLQPRSHICVRPFPFPDLPSSLPHPNSDNCSCDFQPEVYECASMHSTPWPPLR